MDPTVRSLSVDSAFGVTTIVAKPAGLQVGDLLAWFVIDAPFTTLVGGGITTPAAWHRVVSTGPFSQGQRNELGACLWKIADAGDVAATDFECTGTGTGTGDPIAMGSFLVAIVGGTFDPINPIPVWSANGNGTGPGTVTAFGVDVLRAGSLLLAQINSWEADLGPLTGMAELANFGGDGSTLDGLTVAAGETGDLTCSSSITETWCVILIAVQPDGPTEGAAMLLA